MTTSDRFTFHIIVPVWGEEYRAMFFRYSLPSLLSERNFPMLAGHADLVFLFCTKSEDRGPLGAAIDASTLAALGRVEILTPACTETDISPYKYFSACYQVGLDKARQTEGYVVLLTADQIWADGAIEFVYKQIRHGWQGVLATGPRLIEETAQQALESLQDMDRAYGNRLTPSVLVELAIEHMHPWDRSLFWNDSDTGRPASFMYWDVPGDGFLMHCLHLHPVCIRVDCRTSVHFSETIDKGNFIEKVCPPATDCYIIRSSEEIMHCSMAPAEQSAHLLDYPKGNWRAYANWALNMGLYQHNLYFIEHGIRFQCRSVEPEAWERIEQQAAVVCGTITAYLGKKHFLLMSRLYFWLNQRYGQTFRSNSMIVRLYKLVRHAVGLYC